MALLSKLQPETYASRQAGDWQIIRWEFNEVQVQRDMQSIMGRICYIPRTKDILYQSNAESVRK